LTGRHGLSLRTVLDGICALAEGFPGRLVSETMLVEDLNDTERSVRGVAEFLGIAGITTAYVAIPTRPPGEPGVRGPDEAVVARAHQILAERVPHVEYLVGYEGDASPQPATPGGPALHLAVHPLRDSAVRAAGPAAAMVVLTARANGFIVDCG
jgi:hypothetical protein